MSKEQLKGLGLIEAKVLAAKKSRESGKPWYVLVDAEGDCEVSEKADKSAYCAFKGGNEIALSSDVLTTNEPKAKASKKSKKSDKQDEVEALLETDPTNASTEKLENNSAMKTKSAKKTATKKAAAPKKKAEPKVKAEKAPSLVEIKADSYTAAVKEARKQGAKKAKVIIKGKEFGLRSSSGWAVVRSIVELGKDGFIMDVQGVGFYVYPKSAHKELFGKIFSSSTYKNIGIYSQSTLPKWHEEHFTALK